jgi:hypothetical protein
MKTVSIPPVTDQRFAVARSSEPGLRDIVPPVGAHEPKRAEDRQAFIS